MKIKVKKPVKTKQGKKPGKKPGETKHKTKVITVYKCTRADLPYFMIGAVNYATAMELGGPV